MEPRVRNQNYVKDEFYTQNDIVLPYKSISFKVLLLAFLIFTVTLLGVFYQIEKQIENTNIGIVKDELRSIATIAATNINGDLVEELQKPEQEISKEYQFVQNSLMQLIAANERIHDVYIMRKGENHDEVYFVVDSTIGEGHAQLGEAYSIIDAPDILEGFCHPAVDKEFTNDKWGQTLSGYAPIKNTKGEIVAIIGIDFDANQVKLEAESRSRYIIFWTVMGLLLILTISFIVANRFIDRLNNIKYVIEMLLDGKLDVLVHDTGNDEIKDLGMQVNKLIKKLIRDKERTMMSMTVGLVNALEAKDKYTHGHSAQVAIIAEDIMRALQIGGDECFTIKLAAILHDVGKIGISDSILHKESKLTVEEFSVIKEHPLIGAKILEGNPSLRQIQEIIKHHHERYDGHGYPSGLEAENIPFGARVIAIADSFQAMISDRPYRKGMEQEVAMRELEKNKGLQFDSKIVDVFLMICEDKQYK